MTQPQSTISKKSGSISLRHYVAGSIVTLLALLIGVALSSRNTHAPSVQEYYSLMESRIGYWLILGNTRHCGLYPKGQLLPFPISKAHRAMEKKLHARLSLPAGSRVLDAGAGSGHVAMYMARQGIRVQAIDITPHHIVDARRTVEKNGLGDWIQVAEGDYHDLSAFSDSSFDGIYTMETFVHADDPKKALAEFWRVLKPGGVLVMHEGDFNRDSEKLRDVLRLSHCGNTLREGQYRELITKTGFVDYDLEDLSDQVLPLWRFFGVLGYIPYKVLRVFGLQDRAINVMAGVETWLNWKDGRYISVRAVKPQ
ncbi:S-adenosyl-L-methionine-dependent methyltransferase [Massarina eburnea CBS 473.64]|uniref:S-adenosyl-L-methionine-dependent methyltransferase n=1 Tax=Massarina eburnea CBS 473.64 TaxID=1395130 RepID=A0A6A6RM77_9PLEO|nr:S-adenosyl-L-methionine-dependent methyltransferase [Massarina eburnea CBS 473.64]